MFLVNFGENAQEWAKEKNVGGGEEKNVWANAQDGETKLRSVPKEAKNCEGQCLDSGSVTYGEKGVDKCTLHIDREKRA